MQVDSLTSEPSGKPKRAEIKSDRGAGVLIARGMAPRRQRGHPCDSQWGWSPEGAEAWARQLPHVNEQKTKVVIGWVQGALCVWGQELWGINIPLLSLPGRWEPRPSALRAGQRWDECFWLLSH